MDRRPLLRIRASCCTHAADPSPVLRAPAVSSPSYYLYALSDRVATQASVDRRADSPACLPTIFGLRLARCRTLTWPAGNHTYQARPSVGRVRLPLTRSGPANNLLVDRLAIGPTVSLAASPSCIARSGPLCPPADADCRPSARRPSRLWRDRWSILRCRPHACPEPRSPSAGEHCHPSACQRTVTCGSPRTTHRFTSSSTYQLDSASVGRRGWPPVYSPTVSFVARLVPSRSVRAPQFTHAVPLPVLVPSSAACYAKPPSGRHRAKPLVSRGLSYSRTSRLQWLRLRPVVGASALADGARRACSPLGVARVLLRCPTRRRFALSLLSSLPVRVSSVGRHEGGPGDLSVARSRGDSASSDGSQIGRAHV